MGVVNIRDKYPAILLGRKKYPKWYVKLSKRLFNAAIHNSIVTCRWPKKQTFLRSGSTPSKDLNKNTDPEYLVPYMGTTY
jgi:hypothetical protein